MFWQYNPAGLHVSCGAMQSPAAGSERVLLVDDDESLVEVCEMALRLAGCAVRTAASGDEALRVLEAESFDLVLTDLQMPGRADGQDVLAAVKSRHPSCDAIVLTGGPSIESAVTALRRGAYDYVVKPFHVDQLSAIVRRCLEHRRLRKDLESERALRRELESAYQELQKLERLKESFLARVSHELRTPLSELSMALHVLEQSGPGGRTLELAKAGARKLEARVAELTDFVELQRAPAAGPMEELDLERLCREQAERLRPLWEPMRLEFSIEFEPDARKLRADPQLLPKAVGHLLHNAVVFNREGGRVAVRGRTRSGRLELAVSDAGPGIPASEFDRVFDSFYQVAHYLTRKVGGLGLGLAITRRIVEAHGGEILVSSRIGEGSTFTVLLPLR